MDFSSRSIRVRDIRTGSERELYKLGGSGMEAVNSVTISPDGSQVAFLSKQKARDASVSTVETSLVVVATAGGPPRPLKSLKLPARFSDGLAWSPDSRYIYYFMGPAALAPCELFRIGIAEGQAESMGLTADYLREPNISPDGTRIAFSIGDVDKVEIWTLENFLPQNSIFE